MADAEILLQPALVDPEAVRLIIWDLDETFWHGTLSEGGITPIEENIALVKELSQRGIVNSICSKNHFEPAKAELQRLGIWDYFIFPRIEFAPKGPMIREIIEAVQLRAPTILFLDDNQMNLNEALHYSPGLQVALPTVIPGLRDDWRFKGKPDLKMARLANYKVLEQKHWDKEHAGGDNFDFIRQSQVRVSLHYDVLEQFPRIHDLVNRTNQLNFTKNRWPEPEAEALAAFNAEAAQSYQTFAGYVKVADRYGSYGICGFFMVQEHTCKHFAFSCRTLNMGVEQFVWQHLQRPLIDIKGEVISSLQDRADWITLVDDVDHNDTQFASESVTDGISVCLIGSCETLSMAHYLRTKFDVSGESTYAYKGWAVVPSTRRFALADEINTQEAKQLVSKMFMIPADYFNSKIHTGEADVYVLGFALEGLGGYIRSRSTGLVFHYDYDRLAHHDFSMTSYEQLQQACNGDPGFSKEEWNFLQMEFESLGHRAPFDTERMTADLNLIFEKLKGKTVIYTILNERVGSSPWLLQRYAEMNRIAVPIAKAHGAYFIDYADTVKTLDDLIDPEDHGTHFARHVYAKMSSMIEDIVKTHTPQKIRKPQDAAAKFAICLRGGDECVALERHIKQRHRTIPEYPMVFKGLAITPWARTLALAPAAKTAGGKALMKKLSVLPNGYFSSSLLSGEADAYLLSFSQETTCGLYRSKSTGMMFSFYLHGLGERAFRDVSYAEISAYNAGNAGFSEQEWQFLQAEFDYVGHDVPGVLSADVVSIFEKLRGKTVIVLGLNERVGAGKELLQAYGNINRIVLPLARSYGFEIVEIGDFVHSENDLLTPDDYGFRFSAAVYEKLAARILEICSAYVAPAEAGSLN